MTALSDFTLEQAELIVRLPYRVGLNVSYAEDEQGERDDRLEMQALEACIREISKTQEGLAKEVATEILNSREDWLSWSDGVFNLGPSCEEAVLAIKSKASQDEARAYVKMVLDIASSVAQAYGEFGEGDELKEGFFGKLMAGIVARVTAGSDVHHPMNISAAEDSAISSIAAALNKNL